MSDPASKTTEPPKYPIHNIRDVHIANKIMIIEAGVAYVNSNFDNCEIRVPIDSDTPSFFYCHFENCDFVPPLRVDMTNEHAEGITDHRMKGCGVYEQTPRPVYPPRVRSSETHG